MTIKYPVNNEYFDVWSHNMAYVLGFTMADGCLHKRPGGRKQTLCYSVKDYEILEFIRNEISPTRPVKNAIFKENLKYNLPERHGFNLRIPINENCVKTIQSYGMLQKKTGFETCPDIPKEFIGDYLRGIFDGNGSIFITEQPITKIQPRYSFCITFADKKMLEGLNSKIGNIGNIYPIKNKQAFKLQVAKQPDILTLYHLLYDNKRFCLQRKKEIYNGILNYGNETK
jgi:hypothetical protein